MLQCHLQSPVCWSTLSFLDANRVGQNGKPSDGVVKSFRLWCPYGSHRNREAYYLWRGHTDDPGGSRVL